MATTGTRSELLTATEVIDRLLTMPPHLRRLATTCVLPAVRVGEEWRFRREDLETWIEEAYKGQAQGGSAVSGAPSSSVN